MSMRVSLQIIRVGSIEAYAFLLSPHIYVRAPGAKPRGAMLPQEKFSPPLEKCVRHGLKLLDMVQKTLGPSQKTLRSCWCTKLVTGLSCSIIYPCVP